MSSIKGGASLVSTATDSSSCQKIATDSVPSCIVIPGCKTFLKELSCLLSKGNLPGCTLLARATQNSERAEPLGTPALLNEEDALRRLFERDEETGQTGGSARFANKRRTCFLLLGMRTMRQAEKETINPVDRMQQQCCLPPREAAATHKC